MRDVDVHCVKGRELGQVVTQRTGILIACHQVGRSFEMLRHVGEPVTAIQINLGAGVQATGKGDRLLG